MVYALVLFCSWRSHNQGLLKYLASQQWLEDTSATEPLRRWHHSTVHGCTSPKTPIGISSSQIRQILELERSILAAQSRRLPGQVYMATAAMVVRRSLQ